MLQFSDLSDLGQDGTGQSLIFENVISHTPLGAAAASAASLTFIKLPYITIARYIITITSTYTQSKTVLFYSLLINMKGLGGWDTVKLR